MRNKRNKAFSVWNLAFGCQRTEAGSQKITNNQMPKTKFQMLNAKCQMQKGITLIALIITVIILLILAGAAISIAINGGDIFGKTSIARERWNATVEQEEGELVEVLNVLNQAMLDPLEIPEGLATGDTVTWTPSGTYTEWKANYYSNDDTADKILYSGTATTTVGAMTSTDWSDSTTNIDMTISSWKVLDVNIEKNIVKLVPSLPTTSGVKLSGTQGYNNGVKLLNDACDALYGGAVGNSDGITARSINIVDLEGTAGDGSNGLMSADTSKITSAKAGTPAYGEQHITGFSNNGVQYRNSAGEYIVRKAYPRLYEEESIGSINPQPSFSGTRLGMSDGRKTFIGRENSKVEKTDTSIIGIHPTRTYYYLSNSDFMAALGTTNKGLILPNESSTRSYWVASRCIALAENLCGFYIRRVNDGDLGGCGMFVSSDETYGGELGLFPIVTLSSGTLSGSNHTYTYTSAM